MTRTLLAALGAGSIAFAASAHAPFGFGHRSRFFFAPDGVGGDGGGDADAGADQGDTPSLADIIGGAFDETLAAEPEDTNNGDADRAAAEQAAAVAADTKNRPETPAATADKVQPAPDQWTSAEQAAFDALPPQTKALVEKRVASIEAGYREKVTLADEVSAVLDDGLKSRLSNSGMSVGQGVAYLANLEKFASTQPAEYLAFVANHVQSMGVDVAKTLGLTGQDSQKPQPAQGDDGFSDPRVATLEQRLASFEKRTVDQARQQAFEEAGRQIAAVRDAKGPDGQPLRPYFAQVEPQIDALLKANPRMSLEDAYDAAVWSNPDVRAKALAEQKAADERKARSEAANAAKAAKANVRSGQRSMSPNPTIRNSRDAVNAALDGIDF